MENDHLNDFSVCEGLFKSYFINNERVEFIVSNILLPRFFLEEDGSINEETVFKLVFLKYSYLKVEIFSKDKSKIELGTIGDNVMEYSGSFGKNYINIKICSDSIVAEKL